MPVDPVKSCRTGKSESEKDPFKVKTGGISGDHRCFKARNWMPGPEGPQGERREKKARRMAAGSPRSAVWAKGGGPPPLAAKPAC